MPDTPAPTALASRLREADARTLDTLLALSLFDYRLIVTHRLHEGGTVVGDVIGRSLMPSVDLNKRSETFGRREAMPDEWADCARRVPPDLPRYSTDPAAALSARVAMGERGYAVSVTTLPPFRGFDEVRHRAEVLRMGDIDEPMQPVAPARVRLSECRASTEAILLALSAADALPDTAQALLRHE